MARLADDLRVRTLESANTNAVSGASKMRGTAHPRVVDGSNEKPVRRVADAAAKM
jgi:hypothetical protein